MELTNLTQFIPENLMVVIITFSVLLNLINTEYSVIYKAIVNAVLQGILCWGVSVGINQTTKQLTKNE